MEKEKIKLNKEAPIVFTKSVEGYLGDMIEVKPSEIHGEGLFARYDILEDVDLQQTHCLHPEHGWVNIKPNHLFNHSETPNCKLVRRDSFYHLYSVRPIECGEELTVDYRNHKEVGQPEEGWKK
jgi:hypothetical protein